MKWEAVARKEPQGDFPYGALEGMRPHKIGVIFNRSNKLGSRRLPATNESSVNVSQINYLLQSTASANN